MCPYWAFSVRNLMKLFQQLLVAPAAFGLLAPMAATAADLNLEGVSDYSAASEQVSSISQFSDIQPTDWAYQALSSLVESNQCSALSSGTGLESNRAITRYEAAALLNACLDNVSELNDAGRRLIKEFSPELATIQGRVDGLEAKVGEFGASQFSTTTKMRGTATFNIGAVDRDSATDEATVFQYVYQLNLNTSFTGNDLLYTRIKTGNGSGPFSSKTYGTYLSANNGNGDALKVDKLWYQFPVGDNVKVWIGPKIENYYMLASTPSIYKPVLKQFALGGNGSTYGASTSPGFGAAWIQQVDPGQPRFAVSTNYVAKNGASADDEKGLFDDKSKSNWLTKVEYGSSRWQVSAAMAVKQCDDDGGNCFDGGSYYSTKAGKNRTGDSTNLGLRAYWKPEETGAIPAVSVGYDIANIDDPSAGGTEETAQWMVGLSWRDLFVDGNSAGLAFGQRQYATEIKGGGDDPADDNFMWEAYYTFKVSDNVSVTPSIFGGSDTYNGTDDDLSGALVQTTFKF